MSTSSPDAADLQRHILEGFKIVTKRFGRAEVSRDTVGGGVADSRQLAVGSGFVGS